MPRKGTVTQWRAHDGFVTAKDGRLYRLDETELPKWMLQRSCERVDGIRANAKRVGLSVEFEAVELSMSCKNVFVICPARPDLLRT